jgi:CheY-like chemotaxis protein
VRVGTNSKGKSILCVDDEAVGPSVRKMLLESRGYRVFTVQNGADALVLFSSEDIDLVVLDYLMLGMNGDAVARKMKDLRPGLPIVMFSAYVDLPNEILALVDKSVTKGEAPTILLKAIAELLDDRHEPRSRSISAD